MKSILYLGLGTILCCTLSLAPVVADAGEAKDETKKESTGDEKAEEAEPEYEKDENGRPVKKDVYVIQIKNHRFLPARIVVPAGEKIKLRIENLDPTPEEFESHDFNREKIVTGGGKITIFVGPLKPGTYKYFGEFHEDTAQGIIIAK